MSNNSVLEARFYQPKGWITKSFRNPETGHDIHYGCVSPENGEAKAIVVCLAGLSEFSEKYYEVAQDMLGRGYAFWIMDWQYQGRSGRLKPFKQRRHSDGFETDMSDLLKFIDEHVCSSPEYHTLPLIMLAHSMGGNIGLRFLSEHPTKFAAAAFSAPFLGIHNFTAFLKLFVQSLSPFMPFIGTSYVFGAGDWNERMRTSNGKDKFSGDPLRDAVHNHWSKSDEKLQIGGPTFGWIAHALKSCAILAYPETLKKIQIPVLLAAAGRDEIVDNAAIRNATKYLANVRLLEIRDAKHEILMERDEYRSKFFMAFDKMLEDNKITK